MTLHPDYIAWKEIMDSMYAGQISEQKAVEEWLNFLSSKNIKTRPDNHTQERYSYFVYNKEEYADKDRDKPLGLGIVYTKPDGKTETQDIFIAHPLEGIGRYYSDEGVRAKYPSMDGTHKNNLPPIK